MATVNFQQPQYGPALTQTWATQTGGIPAHLQQFQQQPQSWGISDWGNTLSNYALANQKFDTNPQANGSSSAYNLVGNPITSQNGAPSYGQGAAGVQGNGMQGSGMGGIGAMPTGNMPNLGGGPMGMQNPYLKDQSNAITSQVTDNLQRNILPGLRYGAMAAGGYGGSRQGVLEANALKDANSGLAGALSNLYGNNYQFDRNLNTNFYTAQRGQDLQQAALAASLLGQGTQGIYNVGTTQQNAPWNAIGNAAQVYSPFTGLGATTTGSTSSGGGLQGIIGGALGGAQLGRNMGWW